MHDYFSFRSCYFVCDKRNVYQNDNKTYRLKSSSANKEVNENILSKLKRENVEVPINSNYFSKKKSLKKTIF